MARKAAKALPRNLRLKGQTFWFARDLPADCRSIFGKKTWMTSLETADIKVAIRARDELEIKTAQAFKEMRAGTWKPEAGLSASERGEIYRELITTLSGNVTDSRDAASDREQGISPKELGLRLLPEERESEGDALALELAVYAAESERDAYRGTLRKGFDEAISGAVDVDQHVDAYAKAISSLAKATVAGRKGHIRQFARWATEQKARLTSVDRRVAGKYVSTVIEPMDPKTAAAHLSSLRLYWAFLHKRGLINGGDTKGGPWADQTISTKGTRVNRGKKDDVVRAYTEGEVRALLYSPFPPRMTAAFEPPLRDALRISLLSGMRLEEIVTLLVEEVNGGDFDIQQGKTSSAARRVPIHSSLTEIVQRRTEGKRPTDWLFHELAALPDPADTMGKRFHNYRLAVGVDDKREGKRPSLVNFHSARHWFARTASFAHQSDAVIASVIGHRPDEKNITRSVYIQDTSREQQLACVEAVKLPVPVADLA
jgi:integrase